jgi:glycosyltransferase involved in cell wall biosynthesis
VISILILTLNEETNIGQCLDCLTWSDDVVVFDSFSSDRTVDIARERGARVVQRKFDNWAAHQNWAMENIDFKYPWVFYLDADERMTEELREEICKIAANEDEKRVAYYCGRKNFFMGKWLKHAMPPGTIMRFFKPPFIRFERLVNPTPVIDGDYGYLSKHFLHFNFSKGLAEWFDKHNRYSTFEAMEGLKVMEGGMKLGDIFSKDEALRRQALKRLGFVLPMSYILRFIWMYVVKGGWLDGRAGLTYCQLQALYQYLIVLKMKEFRLKDQGVEM